MFGYNLTTMIIILAIALLLFGPRRLPELGDSIGKAIRSFKKGSRGPRERVLPKPRSLTQLHRGFSQSATCPQCHKEVGGTSPSVPIAAAR